MKEEHGGLSGLRVLEFPDPKSALCGSLLTQLGADVVLVEPPEGAPFRQSPPFLDGTQQGLPFAYYNRNKRSVCLDLDSTVGREELLRLVANADVVLESFAPGSLEAMDLAPARLRAANPALILAQLTGFGQSGPFRDFQISDIVGWALGGLMSLSGDPQREPLTAPAFQAYQMTSLWMTMAIQAALYRCRETGQGSVLDVSVHETVFSLSETAHSFYFANKERATRTNGDHPMIAPFRGFKSADGDIFVSVVSPKQWSALLDWMRSQDFDLGSLEDPALADFNVRVKRRDEVNGIVAKWVRGLTNEELFLGGAERAIPMAPIRLISEVVEDEQLQEREFFAKVPVKKADGSEISCPVPRLPFRSARGPWKLGKEAAPGPGEHTNEVFEQWTSEVPQRPTPTKPARTLPLEGLRILEVAMNMAGPIMGQVLGDLGATVLKVEPPATGDACRFTVPFADHQVDQNGSFTFQDLNRNKLDLTINMKHPEGNKLALELARGADVVLENFTAGAMDRLGLGYENLAKINPAIVLGSLSGYGQTGARRSWPSYHPTSAALCGLIGLFAYEGEEPLGFGNSHMDYVAGYFGAIGVLDALLRRQRTGNGDHVDISQLESGVQLVGPQIFEWCVNQETPRAEGNRSGALGALLQGCYRCSGEDDWIVLTVPDQDTLAALAETIKAPPSASLSDVEATLTAWALQQGAWAAFYALQGAGVPAGVVSHGQDLVERDEHLRARGNLVTLDHPVMGTIGTVPCPVRMDGALLPLRSPAPLFGEHSEYVIRELLERSEEQYAGYVAEKII